MKTFYLLFISFFAFSSAIASPHFHEINTSPEEAEWALNDCQNDWKIDSNGKHTYIKPEAIQFLNNKIYLIAGPVFIPLASIHCDDLGYYFCHEGWIFWECCFCHTWNSTDWNTCQKCHHQRC